MAEEQPTNWHVTSAASSTDSLLGNQSTDSHSQHTTIIFEKGDPQNPRNWPLWQKWLIVGVIIPIDLSVSWGATGFAPAIGLFVRDFDVSHEVATLGLSLYIFGLALGPMTLAPLSEHFGRSPVYTFSYAIFLVLLVCTALVQNIPGFCVLRVLSGIFSSVTVANLGGTIADLFDPHETGTPMSVFLWAATCGGPSGYFLFSFVATSHGWRSVFWALFATCGAFWLLMVIFLRETRHTVILRRKFQEAKKASGNEALEEPDSVKPHKPVELAKIVLGRPVRFLSSEAIVMFAAIYNGYLYGLSFLFNTAFVLVFGPEGHGFSTTGVGCSFLGLVVGISLGPITNILQEQHYQRLIIMANGRNIPEARVYHAKLAAITLPISLFWFAWTSDKSVHWVVPMLASVLWGWSFYTLILMLATYTEDSYKVFSASALAGIGLVRNIAGAAFPLFGRKLYVGLGYQWSTTLLGFLSLLLVPIPFVLSKHGRYLRSKSPWARQHMDDLDDEEIDDE